MDTSNSITSTLNLNLRIQKRQHRAIPKVIHLLDISKFDKLYILFLNQTRPRKRMTQAALQIFVKVCIIRSFD